MSKKWDKRFLELAQVVSTWSKDPSTQTGAVIVDSNNRVLSLGYNGFPQGVKDDPEKYENRELKYKMIVHCEQNAILFADRSSLKGATLYTYPFISCSRCASIVAQSGITRCIAPILEDEGLLSRWGDELLITRNIYKEAGIKFKEIDQTM